MTLPASLSLPDGTRYAHAVVSTQRFATLKGDEELAEWNFECRTHHPSWTQPFPCTPSVVRWYPQPRAGSGDYRVDISPMESAICALNGETSREEPKSRYLFHEGTAIYNKTGFPMQAYITMQGNKLSGSRIDDWFVFETLKPSSNVAGMTHASHPQFVHRFDLVCWNDRAETTTHKPVRYGWEIYYYLVSDEGVGWIQSKYVKL